MVATDRVSPFRPALIQRLKRPWHEPGKDFRDASMAYAASHKQFDFQKRIPILAIVALHHLAPTRALTDFL